MNYPRNQRNVPKNSRISNATCKRALFRTLFCGGEGGILRFAFGLLALRAARTLGGASRGGKTVHRTLFRLRPSNPSESQHKQEHPCGCSCLWRRRRDSNPRNRFAVYTISSRAPSTKLGDFSMFYFASGQKARPKCRT